MSLFETPISASPFQIGYCTNVHAGRDLAAVLENLTKYCLPIRNKVDASSLLGIGLWFSEESAKQALETSQLRMLSDRLTEYKLVPFTLNGFPQGDFHQQIVKHRVYQPEWWRTERLEYTLNLVQILDVILPEGLVGSISTLPISWGDPIPTDEQIAKASEHLLKVAKKLHRLYESSGRFITLAIEPEPGCYLTDSQSLRIFFRDHLSSPRFSESDSELAHRYLSVCHDVCHAAVMYEDQSHELAFLKSEGISIGKVQVSSAVEIDWNSKSGEQRKKAFEQLRGFVEERYLHQTHCRRSDGQLQMFEDLPLAISLVDSPSELEGSWRVHFHVPIYLEAIGELRSTQNEINKLLGLMNCPNEFPKFTGHFEIETYAWGVAPQSIRVVDLCEGIADEIQWFKASLAASELQPKVVSRRR